MVGLDWAPIYNPSMKERLAQLEADRVALISDAAPIEAPKVDVLVHPNLPELYRRKVSELEQLLEAGAERDEARDVIRSMIDRVVLMPRKIAEGLDATLYGELGAILAICAKATNDADTPLKSGSQLSVVAGARNRLDLQRTRRLSSALGMPRAGALPGAQA